MRNFSRAREFAEVEPSPAWPPQMRGFPRPRPMGIRAGFSFGERQTFVGNPTNGPRVRGKGIAPVTVELGKEALPTLSR